MCFFFVKKYSQLELPYLYLTTTNNRSFFSESSEKKFRLKHHITRTEKCCNASVNSTCAQPRADPRALASFLSQMANSRVGDKKRRQMPCPPSTLQHFSLIAQSNSAILSILMFDFFVLINVFFCNSARILTTYQDSNDSNDDMHQFMVL